MIVHVTQVKVVGPHSLYLEFDNGICKQVNLRRELFGQVFEPLRDPTCFAQAYLDPDARTVTWPNGADLAPDFLLSLEPETVAPETVYA